MLRLAWDNTTCTSALQLSPTGALADDGALETLVLVSLFTDLQATDDEIAAAGLDQQRGWWADADPVRPASERRMGSKLWLLSREKTTLATLRRAQLYALDSLLWLKAEGIAASVGVTASRPLPGFLGLEIVITRPSKLAPPFRRFWQLEHHAV